MNDLVGYAVFFFPPALEALGDAIKPYLEDGPNGPHVPCRDVDTGGAFIELTLEGHTSAGQPVDVELMVPANMVRMIVSARGDAEFGFQLRRTGTPVILDPGVTPVSETEPAPTEKATDSVASAAAPAEPAS